MTLGDGATQSKLTDRILIIGWDGATYDVLTPLMEKGYMPALKKIVDNGASGNLMSTKPPITPAAWTTFMTGKGPGKHRIIDFEHYDPGTNSTQFNTTFQIKEKTIWRLLSDNGLRCGTIHLPMTYPPQPVNGFVISGFETPSVDADFTYPSSLKEIVLKEFPDYTYSTNWQRGPGKFEANLEHFKNSFRQSVKLTKLCTNTCDWHALMVLFKLVDNIQHKCWMYLTPEAAKTHPQQQKMVFDCFKVLDECLAELVELAESRQAAVLLMSDHGHGSLDGSAQPNLLLHEWGYLAFKSPFTRAKTRMQHIWHRLTKKRGGRFTQPLLGVEHDLAIDWSRTKACVMHAGIYGFLYLNLQGRQPCGVVAEKDYERTRQELAEKLLAARDETYNEPIFQEVLTPEQAYGCTNDRVLPDLMLVPKTGLRVVRKIRGGQRVQWAMDGRLGGTHRLEGIYAISAPNVKPGVRRNAGIADITPTVLGMLGIPVPADMEGRVIDDVFEPKLKVEFEPPRQFDAADGTGQTYSDQEQKLVTDRLLDLGYLE